MSLAEDRSGSRSNVVFYDVLTLIKNPKAADKLKWDYFYWRNDFLTLNGRRDFQNRQAFQFIFHREYDRMSPGCIPAHFRVPWSYWENFRWFRKVPPTKSGKGQAIVKTYFRNSESLGVQSAAEVEYLHFLRALPGWPPPRVRVSIDHLVYVRFVAKRGEFFVLATTVNKWENY